MRGLDTLIGPLKLKAWLGIAALLALLAFVVIRVADNADKRKIETAKEAGASEAVAKGQEIILDQVEKANAAEDQVRRGGDAARYELCMRYATEDTRLNCEPLKPVSD